MPIRSWSIRTRLILAFVGVLIPYVVLVAVVRVGFRTSTNAISAVSDEATREMVTTSAVETALNGFVSELRRYASEGAGADRGGVEKALGKLHDAVGRAAGTTFDDVREQQLLILVEDHASRLESAARQFVGLESPPRGSSGPPTIAAIARLADEAASALNRIQGVEIEEIGAQHLRALRVTRRAAAATVMAIVLSVAGGVALALSFSLWMGRHVRALAEGSRRIAAGDLSHRIALEGGGELGEVGRAFNEMAAALEAAQRALVERMRALEDALAQVKQLGEFLPICAWCRKVRDDQQYWQGLENYISRHLDVRFSHGICPACREKIVKPQIEGLRREPAGGGSP